VNLLLDTHILLWAAARDRMMSERADALLRDEANALWFSAAAIWEIAIKRGLDRPDFRTNPEEMRTGLLSNGYKELPVAAHHAAAVVNLPRVHGDPFDRIMVVQAQVEGMRFVTSDKVITDYGAWVELV
jgi:PIN domain nuclease of toxin-antitoxin system